MRVVLNQIAFFSSLLVGISPLMAQTTTTPASSPAVVTPGRSANQPPALDSATPLTLRQCIDIALQNNITIKQGQLQVQSADLQLEQAKFNRYPNLTGFAGQSLSSGRNINPGTNSFVDRSVSSNNYQVSSSVTLFNGFALQNTIRQNDLLLQSNQLNLQATQNNVALTVVSNYLNVLTNQEQLEVAQRQIEVSRAQLDRTQRLVNAGSAPEANLYDIRATIANDELTIVNAQNNIALAKLALLQTMNLSGATASQGIEVEKIALDDPTVTPYSASAQQVYDIAAQFIPDLKAADLRVRSDAVGVEVAKGSLLPLVSLNGSLSTLYSNVGLQRQIVDGVVQIPQVVTVNGISQTVYFSQPNYRFETYSYTEQLTNNLNRSFSLNLQIPIFGRFQTRTRIALARVQQQSSELTAANTRLQLRQQIETAYTNLLASANRYRAQQVQVEALDKAFQVATARLNAGALNSTEYNISKSNLDRSRAALIQSKYDYVFRTKILDFYQNKPITF